MTLFNQISEIWREWCIHILYTYFYKYEKNIFDRISINSKGHKLTKEIMDKSFKWRHGK